MECVFPPVLVFIHLCRLRSCAYSERACIFRKHVQEDKHLALSSFHIKAPLIPQSCVCNYSQHGLGRKTRRSSKGGVEIQGMREEVRRDEGKR